jgi:hypothetical protein
MVLRTSLDVFVKEKQLLPCRNLNPDRPDRSEVTILTEISRFQRLLAINLKNVRIIIFWTTLKTKTERSSEMLVPVHQRAR